MSAIHLLPSASDLKIELQNLDQMVTVVGTASFKHRLRATLLAEAKSNNSSLTYRNEEGQLVQEWPLSGVVEEIALV